MSNTPLLDAILLICITLFLLYLFFQLHQLNSKVDDLENKYQLLFKVIESRGLLTGLSIQKDKTGIFVKPISTSLRVGSVRDKGSSESSQVVSEDKGSVKESSVSPANAKRQS